MFLVWFVLIFCAAVSGEDCQEPTEPPQFGEGDDSLEPTEPPQFGEGDDSLEPTEPPQFGQGDDGGDLIISDPKITIVATPPLRPLKMLFNILGHHIEIEPKKRTPPVEGWPIMLCFHPGNLSVRATSLWDGSAIAIGQKVIVVTAAYRLNIFGFFSTLDHHVPGNMGLLDQVAALDWVRDKITIFCGNPRNIVLSGHSGGGVSVGLHMLSPHSQGKFSKAIIMSAKGLISRSIKTAAQIGSALLTIADTFGCEPMSNLLVDCLRRQSTTHLLDHTKDIIGEFGPVVDRSYVKNMLPFLPEDPVELVNNQQFPRVPVLTGYTDMEEALDLLEENENTHRGVSWDDYNMAISESVSTDITDLDNDTCLEFLGTSHLNETANMATWVYWTKSQP